MQYSCYKYICLKKMVNIVFVKCNNIINITINFGLLSERVLTLVITEDKLKTIPPLWLCYVSSLFLTDDTSDMHYNDTYRDRVIYIKKICKNTYITEHFIAEVIDIADISDILSTDTYIEENLHLIKEITLISPNLFYELIEDKFSNIERLLMRCEMTVEKIRALNKIIPEDFPRDLYNIIYMQIV